MFCRLLEFVNDKVEMASFNVAKTATINNDRESENETIGTLLVECMLEKIAYVSNFVNTFTTII